MRAWRVAWSLVGFAACAHRAPGWMGPARLEHESAYEWMIIASGAGEGERREEACDLARSSALDALTATFVDSFVDDAQMVAAAGGPSRVRGVLEGYATGASLSAQVSAQAWENDGRRCWCELRWLLPRRLAEAVRRTLEAQPTEAGVAQELRRALDGDDGRAPVSPTGPALQPTAELALRAVYRGWFVRFLEMACPDRRLAFAGAPGGDDARWVVVRKVERGWAIERDEAATGEGWPAVPPVSCD